GAAAAGDPHRGQRHHPDHGRAVHAVRGPPRAGQYLASAVRSVTAAPSRDQLLRPDLLAYGKEMSGEPDVEEVAGALRVTIGLLVRRLRQVEGPGDLTLPERSALARLDRGGPAAPSQLARQEQISPQSMGATVAALESRGLVVRRPDPEDGRRAVISVTKAGL